MPTTTDTTTDSNREAIRDRISGWFEPTNTRGRWSSSVGRYGPVGLLGSGLLLPWVTPSFGTIAGAVIGLATGIGQLIAGLALAVALVTRLQFDAQKFERMFGGLIIILLTLGKLADIRAGITLNGITADGGVGLSLTIVAGLLIIYSGAKSKSLAFTTHRP
jgi:hypothetical protein